MPHIVDTVALIRFMENSPQLGANASAVLNDPQAQLVFPGIVLAEANYVIRKKQIPLDFTAIAQAIGADPRCAVHPTDLDTVLAMPPPPALEMHDALIYATAIVVAAKLQVPVSSVPILTSDRELRAFGAPVVW